MRGKADLLSSTEDRLRITPAYAGKRLNTIQHRRFDQDHPRLCGEKEMKSSPMSSPIGSPPPMRGKGSGVRHVNYIAWDHPRLCGEKKSKVQKSNHIWRITPAYAGKSCRFHFQSFASWDHPRLCGEKTKKIPKQRYFFHQPASFSFSLQYT